MRNASRWQALTAAVLFSTGGAGIKVAAFNGPQVTMLRSGVAAIALILWLRRGFQITSTTVGLGVIYGCMITLFVNSTKLTTAANAIFLQSTAPMYLLILAPTAIGERFRRRDLAYVGTVGAGLVCWRSLKTDQGIAVLLAEN